ncbi:MAG: energy-coupled thiamine transporter ThiT [Bacilli bacterium]|nr:energy-coupled thiamine transporter ThiT [Bacilli bacterium]
MEQATPTTKIKFQQFVKTLYGRILTVHGMVEMAALIALAIVFDLPFLKIRIGEAQSFSLTMLPLMILALRFPIFDSFIGIGFIYGFITNVIDGYGFNTLPFDYILAYGSLSVISLFTPLVFKKNKTVLLNFLFLTLAVIAGVTLRILWSSVSSVIFYETTYWGGIVYNAPTMAISGAVSLSMLFMLYQTLVIFNNKLQKQDNTDL